MDLPGHLTSLDFVDELCADKNNMGRNEQSVQCNQNDEAQRQIGKMLNDVNDLFIRL